MGDKKQETITKYLGDMKAVVSHVYTAMERQKDEFKDQADVAQTIARVALSLKRQDDEIGGRLTALGGSPTHPVKEAVSEAFGVVAGLYNKVRTEGASKALRDDHVALNLVFVSYTMLHTTALAMGDTQTADLAKRSFIECSKFVIEFDQLIPAVVLRELQDGDFGPLDAGAPEQTRSAMGRGWNGADKSADKSESRMTGERT
ncbi:MAG: hypothetical protein M3R54_12090 [Chloroflexota bacterium]|nr:hypothetical protein [Chloroflexota bacterium]